MATDSTLQKIADNLLAQFDKTLLDNSTDFSSCDQILNAAPSEHKGGLESLYCDLLLDALISGYYRYSEMDTKQLVDDPLYTKFKKMVYGLDRSDPYNLLYGKKKDCLKEEEYYRKSLEALPVGENTLNNLGYSLYKQRKFKEAQSVFEDCLRQNRDVRYAANNLVRTLLAQGKNGEAQRVIQEHERFVSKDLKKRAEKPVGKVKIAVPEPAVTDVEAETIVDIGVKKQQFSSEKLLEDELVQRMEIGIPVFGMPLRIYQKRGVYGRQFVLRNGRLDILGIDTAGDLYVIELKKDSGYDDAYAQTREYIDWIEEDVAVKGQRVFGIICLNDPTKDLIEKVKADDQMRLFEYSISYSEII